MPPNNRAPMRIEDREDIETHRMINEAELDKQDRRSLPKASAPDGMIPLDLVEDIATESRDKMDAALEDLARDMPDIDTAEDAMIARIDAKASEDDMIAKIDDETERNGIEDGHDTWDAEENDTEDADDAWYYGEDADIPPDSTVRRVSRRNRGEAAAA